MFDGFCFIISRQSRSAAAYWPDLYSCNARSATESCRSLDCPEQIAAIERTHIPIAVTEINFMSYLPAHITLALWKIHLSESGASPHGAWPCASPDLPILGTQLRSRKRNFLVPQPKRLLHECCS